MFSFFVPRDRWKCDAGQGTPSKQVLKYQRQTLNKGTVDAKKRLLEHLIELARHGPEFQGALCDAKVTADVCQRFLTDTPMIQEFAAKALAALCHSHPANCAAVSSANYKAAESSGSQRVIPHALKLIRAFDKNISLATASAELLEKIGTSQPDVVSQQLLYPGAVDAYLTVIRICSDIAVAQATSAAQSAKLLQLLEQLLRTLQMASSGQNPELCRELGRKPGMKLLLQLVEAHRNQGPVPGTVEGHGDHPAVIRSALSLLQLIASQVSLETLPLLELDGVRPLLGVLRDMTLGWNVRLRAVTTLQVLCTLPAFADEFVRAKGLETVFPIMGSFVTARPAAASPGASSYITPPRTAPGGSATIPSSPGSFTDSMWTTPALPSTPAGPESDVAEPRGVIVVEQLLRLVDAVSNSHAAAVIAEGSRVELLMSAFSCGMANFQAGGYRMATGAAQVLFRLARRLGEPLPAALAGKNVAGPLVSLLEQGNYFATASEAKKPQVLHGAWCAVGVLCQAMKADLGRGRKQEVLVSPALRGAVGVLTATAPVLLAAVGATQGVFDGGLAYLAREGVAEDLRDAASDLLRVLKTLAEDLVCRPTLRHIDAVAAVKKLLPWRAMQYHVKVFLLDMGEMVTEYQPFVRYGCGPLMGTLLTNEGIDPAPFLQKRIDGDILMNLKEDYMRNTLGLDDVGVAKVNRIRAAYSLFSELDAQDGRQDGCVRAADVATYLRKLGNVAAEPAADIPERLFNLLQVQTGEPICFLQFVEAYPWLDGELQTLMRKRRPAPAFEPAGATADDGVSRGSKRMRIGDAAGLASPDWQGRRYLEKD